ncbi:transcription antitermination factor NusB [Candidatus Uhrbacteria bacterium RIFCSPLOWO2_02_FULL_54_37]|uniref:Transcription antitermination protein NusB n=1 Tax=Candidatus Uhrbacteria bacterium RIFCSPLOWO2_02_FULL_54_37 TaxID=1802412 RepID=A0A1F7VGE7_9BACT|nr:MAG: N utilization substance protein B-like protein [Parcubacteria group bacterium GW2011_GWA2_53_21]OGL89586.1 MAG: transcription antitermination factor NusB [Candidatus Uhrbacteria bacterium RIFCSPLOWO2_02_FULL_54_37]
MSNRHLARTIALQSLYQWDFTHGTQDIGGIVRQNLADFAPSFEDGGFTDTLVRGILKHQEAIDAAIVRYAPEWPLDQVTPIDRNILRIGIYELEHSEVPPKVAINESIELAKTFGGESSSKFVNGVLGSIYKDMEAHGRKIVRSGLTSPVLAAASGARTEEPQETSAGGVVYHRNSKGEYAFALIQDAIYRWTFPKGKVEAGETLEQAACEEVGEEVGLKDVRIVCPLGKIHITVNAPGKPPVPKVVHYFLMEALDPSLNVTVDNEVKGGEWVPLPHVLLMLGYENAKEIFRHALKQLNLELPTHKVK